MSTLTTINGGALAVPGLRFWGARNVQGGSWVNRVSLICENELDWHRSHFGGAA